MSHFMLFQTSCKSPSLLKTSGFDLRASETQRKGLDQDSKLEHLRNAGNVSIILFSHVTNQNETKKAKSAVEFSEFRLPKRKTRRTEKMLR